ncbi:MAG: hypothetical protein AAF264_04375, partial [Pseudomonadota bacterium]
TGSAQMRPYAQTLLADAHLAGGDLVASGAALAEVRAWDAQNSVRYHHLVADRVDGDLAAAEEGS